MHNLPQRTIYNGFGAYPLRPEFAESLYYLYEVTGSPHWLDLGREMVSSLQGLARVECGYVSIDNVTSNKQRDWMDSFFLSETLKYLFLLFDAAVDPQDSPASFTGPKLVDGYDTVFTTEAHPISKTRLDAMKVPGKYFGSEQSSPTIAAAKKAASTAVAAVTADAAAEFSATAETTAGGAGANSRTTEPVDATGAETVDTVQAREQSRRKRTMQDPEYLRLVEEVCTPNNMRVAGECLWLVLFFCVNR